MVLQYFEVTSLVRLVLLYCFKPIIIEHETTIKKQWVSNRFSNKQNYSTAAVQSRLKQFLLKKKKKVGVLPKSLKFQTNTLQTCL